MLIVVLVREVNNLIKVLRQGAVIIDLAVEVQTLEVVETIKVLAGAQEAPLVEVIEALAQAGLLQAPDLLAVQVGGEGTKPINHQEFI